MNDAAFVFELAIDRVAKTMNYTCRMCGIEEHGGGIPNPGLYSRMKAHLRSSHAVDTERLKPVHDETDASNQVVWFRLKEADEK